MLRSKSRRDGKTKEKDKKKIIKFIKTQKKGFLAVRYFYTVRNIEVKAEESFLIKLLKLLINILILTAIDY